MQSLSNPHKPEEGKTGKVAGVDAKGIDTSDTKR